MPTEYTTDNETSSVELEQFSYQEIATPELTIKHMRERWWNFFDRHPTKQADLLNTVSRIKTEISKLNPLPVFTGLRVTLGGDKHTH